ncbi:hypothetical protein PIB30_080300 [Stylosanthes scabra]|uniref:RNase H type-1 domain-containing protein n=1 Tax=Stylosanthes scabra TaxID=79078 RepID=A0ABU6VTE8_9FABA|nr:hypothetical protein [Stylosanthes scabra]
MVDDQLAMRHPSKFSMIDGFWGQKRAVRMKKKGGTSAAVFRDWNGNLLTSASSSQSASSELAAEVFAIQEAMIMEKNFRIDKILFESDCSNLIQAIKSETSLA